MKRYLTFALCVASLATAGAQKQAVDQANKLAGKLDKISEARGYINEALSNPETSQDPRTYFVAGKIEFDAYDAQKIKRSANPEDPAANPIEMGNELLKGYEYFIQMMPLDSLPNEKGQIKPKYSKDAVSKIVGHLDDFYGVGVDFFNNKQYYPEAYQAFVIYGDIPGSGMMGKQALLISPEQIANAYFNAGLAAYSGNSLFDSAAAFEKARLNGYDQPEAYIYEIACWQNIAQRDESQSALAQQKIREAAVAGNEKFGLEQPIFINNLINSMVTEGETAQALSMLANIIAENPENPAIYGLRGYVNDRAGNDEASEADYRKAVTLEGVDYETLKNASKKIFKIGTTKLNDVEGSSPEAEAARENLRVEYFVTAQNIAKQARGLATQPDSDLDNLEESIDYALTTYFKN